MKQATYQVISVSVYNEDLERLDKLVGELKARGFTRANRSAVVRLAIEQVNVSKVKKGLQ